MRLEKFRYLAGIVAAHPNRKVIGRTRLQKTVKLLQRLGLPTDYDYTILFYGPYSEGVQSDIMLTENMGLLNETRKMAQDGTEYYIITAGENAELAEMKPFRKQIRMMSQAEPVVLELAATYDAFREMGSDHEEALERVRRKKPSKCRGSNLDKALQLLSRLGLEKE